MSKNDKPATAIAAAEATEEKKEAPFVAAAQSRFSTSAEFNYPLTSYTPQAGTPAEHILRPEYWANVKALKAGCRIWVIPEDEAWFAELLVRQAGPGFAKVHLLRGGDLAPIADDGELAGDYRIEFVNSRTKHRIVRLKDGHVLKEGLADKVDALKWLADYRRMLAA